MKIDVYTPPPAPRPEREITLVLTESEAADIVNLFGRLYGYNATTNKIFSALSCGKIDRSKGIQWEYSQQGSILRLMPA